MTFIYHLLKLYIFTVYAVFGLETLIKVLTFTNKLKT